MAPQREIMIRPLGRPVDRTVRLPGSKSLTNRALLVAAMARGRSELDGVLQAEDTELMADALAGLGVPVLIQRSAQRAAVEGRGGHWPNTEANIECGNAGTVIRFVTAACAAGQGDYVLDGSVRMRQRPIGALVDALRDLGAQIGYGEREGYCPLQVRARGLRGGTVVFDRPVSSQYVSALLMAAPLAANDVMISVEGALPSDPYVRMTLGVMEAFGVSVVEDQMRRFVVPAPQVYSATHYAIEPDASAASYFFAAAALTGGRVTIEGLGSGSVQGDIGFVNLLERMGCRVAMESQQTTVWGTREGSLAGIDADLGAMPDVAPTLAVVAAFAAGPTRIRNVANLRIKESDRLAALATELGHLGVPTELHDDGITVAPVTRPVAGKIDTYGDHRIAMSFALAGLRIDGVVIRDPSCVNKTFPEFFGRLAELG
ncbi:MAG TPA: 3-phosphoshikimate 1-carboxyvinyltransferase [Phycisphaerae bacterium]|nr:3-phosphoshikimate 1-carboxyvinyltransferase [Phycisphaerae bacterium]